jgi:hypothetical protein
MKAAVVNEFGLRRLQPDCRRQGSGQPGRPVWDFLVMLPGGSEWEIVFWEEAANKMIVFITFIVIFINFCVFLLIWINLKKM